MCQDIRNKKLLLTEEQTIGMFWDQAKFSFLLFFSNHHTLKFIKMKCNPTNKNIVA